MAKERTPSFSEAFKAKRALGNKTFEWNGKQYTTELAKSAPAPRAAQRAAPTPTDEDQNDRRLARAVLSNEDQNYRRLARANREEARYDELDRIHEQSEAPLMANAARGFRVHPDTDMAFRKGGRVAKYAKGGTVRGDGCATKGKTKGRFV